MANISITLGRPNGDETFPYFTYLKKPMTVGEFIAEWLAKHPDEWGYFGIYDGKAVFGNPCCEYKYGEILGYNLPQMYLKKPIKEVIGSGGWSRSDFEFKV